MPKGPNQKIKILYLMKILSERTDDEHGLTLREIIDALAEYGVDAERKALYDDLETLRLFGLDIEQRKDRTVRYHVVNRSFELPELKLLVDAVQASRFITHRKSNELIKKVEALASRYEAQQLQRQVFVANRIKTMNESIYYTVDHIHEAIGRNVKVAFGYFEYNAQKQKVLRHNGKRYLISPWALTWDDENYYMIGYDSADGIIKHYRVDKMVQLAVTDEKRDGAELFRDFDMALYSKKTFGMYGGHEELVTLRCKNERAGVVIDRFGAELPFRDLGNGFFEVRVRVHASPPFFTWLMNFSGDIIVTAPANVREALVALAEETVRAYRD